MCPGITLEGPNSSEVWDPEHKNDDADGTNQHFGADQKLIIKMVSREMSRRWSPTDCPILCLACMHRTPHRGLLIVIRYERRVPVDARFRPKRFSHSYPRCSLRFTRSLRSLISTYNISPDTVLFNHTRMCGHCLASPLIPIFSSAFITSRYVCARIFNK